MNSNSSASDLTNRANILHYDNVELYQNELPVLNSVSLKISADELVYLIGKTGCGKSTLLKSIYGEIPINKGKAEVAGMDLTRLKRKNLPMLRRQLGMIFQDFLLLDDRSISENLRFVLKATGHKKKKTITEKIDQALREVGLTHKADKLPYQLSGGEKQRIAIARALINDPVLILADEPTGNLDPETSDEIMSLMVNLQKSHGTAIVIATHDYRLISDHPGRVIRVQEGTLFSY